MCYVCFSQLIYTSIKTKIKEEIRWKVITSPLLFFISGGSRNYTYSWLLTMSTNCAYLEIVVGLLSNFKVEKHNYNFERLENDTILTQTLT